MTTAITIDRLTKVFGSGAGRAVAVDGISLEVAPGELFFLLGPSGCGKTTLLRAIAGFVEPTSGRILFDGRDVTRVAANRRNTGMVFQSYALWPHMTVEANVAFGLSVRRVRGPEREMRVRQALEAVRMLEYAKRRPNQLSGGQQQRVALARALVVRPEVLLLDEPLSNLDAKLRIELRAEIRRICKDFGAGGAGARGITTVYVTHDQKEALSMADRVAIIDRGRVVQIGAPRDLYRRPATRFVAEFVGETNLIEGRLVERSGDLAIVETPIGRLVASSEGMAPAVGAPVVCSVRPEALYFITSPASEGTNRLAGRLIERTYLGDTEQHIVEVGELRLKMAALNPPAAEPGIGAGREVTIGASPSDIVLLPKT